MSFTDRPDFFPLLSLQVTLLFDNNGTVFFAMFMAIWGEFVIILIHIQDKMVKFVTAMIRIHAITENQSAILLFMCLNIKDILYRQVFNQPQIYSSNCQSFYDHSDMHCQGKCHITEPTLPDYSYLNQHRPSGRGGGRAFIYKDIQMLFTVVVLFSIYMFFFL